MAPLSLFNAVLDRTLSMIAPILPSPESGTWVDATHVTEKAGKAANAGVPTRLWDQRVSLVLAVPARILNIVTGSCFDRAGWID